MGVFIHGWVSSVPWQDVHKSSRVVTEPTDEPVSVQEVKRYLRVVEPDTDDEGIERLISTARRKVETDTRRSLMNTTWEFMFDAFPGGVLLELPQSRLISVTSVTSYATDGTPTVLPTSQYAIDTISTPGRVFLKENGSWPTGLRTPYAGAIQYVAGYGTDPSLVPNELILAIKERVVHWWEERRMVNTEIGSTVVPTIPYQYDDLIHDYIVGGVTIA